MATGDLVACCGFGARDPAKDVLTAQTTTGGTVTEVVDATAPGGNYLQVARTSVAACSYRWRTTDTLPPFPSGKASLSGSVWFMFTSLPSSATSFIDVMANVGAGVGDVFFTMDSAGQVRLVWGGQAAVTVGSTITANTWHQLEWQVNYGATTWTCAVRLDGGTTVNGTNKTGQSSDLCFGLYEIGISAATGATFTCRYSSLVYVDGLAWPGPVYVHTRGADDSPADLDANWTITGTGVTKRADAIDDVADGVAPDDATTYIASSTSGQVQRVETVAYTLSGSQSIVGVQGVVRGGSTTTGGTPAFAMTLQNSAGTDHGTATTLTYAVNGWRNQNAVPVWLTPPGGGSWDQSALNGVRMKFTHAASTTAVRITSALLYIAVLTPQSVTEQALTGGGVGGGVAPAVRITTPQGGGVGGGATGPAARVATPQGGGVGAGTPPAAVITAQVQQGGALGGGTPPGARSAVDLAGSSAGGAAPGVTVAAPQGGGVGAGTAPAAVITAQAGVGGSLGAGTAPGSSAAAGQGGAAGGAGAPVVRALVATGGAVAGGVEPGERLTDTAVQGGAVAGGTSPTGVVASSPQGGAPAAGTSPTVAVAVQSGGAVAGGVEPSAVITAEVQPGGAVGAGTSPTARATVGAPGGAAGAGFEAAAAVLVPPGGAAAGGYVLGEQGEDQAGTGGGTAAGTAPGAAVTVATGAAGVGGTSPTGAVAAVETGGATAGGHAPEDGFTSGDNADTGGAVAGGFEPSARVTLDRGSALAGGPDLAVRVAVGTGAAAGGGVEPGEIVSGGDTAGRGGAQAAGLEPSAAVAVGRAGAAGAGHPAAGARAQVGTGGALAGGVEPGELEGEAIGRGGAIGGGVAPVARTAATSAGVVAAGQPPTARSGVAVGGGTAAGPGFGVAVAVAVGGALAGGTAIIEPDEGLSVVGGGIPRLGLDTTGVI